MDIDAYDRCLDAIEAIEGLREMIIAGVFDPDNGCEHAPFAAHKILEYAVETLTGVLRMIAEETGAGHVIDGDGLGR